MNILITNDDGIMADGLLRLAKAAMNFGNVWVIAPDGQRSGTSHSIHLRKSIDAWEYDFPLDGVRAYACDGSPSDCVRIGVRNIIPGKTDCVLSGINYGYNVATDIQYSGTTGAAFEGAFQGINSIAFSEGACENHCVTDKYLNEILEELLEHPLTGQEIWNVNFPGCDLSECQGILRDRSVSTDVFYDDEYDETIVSPTRKSYMVNGTRKYAAEPGTDLRAIFDRYISIGIANNIS